jgi:hypothetical protein
MSTWVTLVITVVPPARSVRPAARNDQYLPVSQKARPLGGKTLLRAIIGRRSRLLAGGNASTAPAGPGHPQAVRSENAGRSEPAIGRGMAGGTPVTAAAC